LFFKEVSGGEEDKLAGGVADEGGAHPAKGWGMGRERGENKKKTEAKRGYLYRVSPHG
jgi:hypothetical protein